VDVTLNLSHYLLTLYQGFLKVHMFVVGLLPNENYKFVPILELYL
jgi:hypothetical protein